MKRALPVLAILTFLLFLSTQVRAEKSYKLSMLPRYSPGEINKRITPLAKLLSKVLHVTVEPTIVMNFDQYTKHLNKGDIQIGYENPYIYVLVSGAHEVLAMAVKGKSGDKFRGIIITKRGSNIKDLADLKGKRIAIVSRTSAGGYLSQKLTLMKNGIDLEKDCNVFAVTNNKQENVIISVFIGEADAGFIRESALSRAAIFVPPSQIVVINRSAWLPNWALSVSRSFSKKQKEAIQKVLLSLKKDGPVLKALKIDSFKLATDSDYNSVRKAAGMLP
ncbi:ABC transporter, phosphonate, periplasmic substrate-binding protein [bacterium BMS3Bbin14]|nr:ABC transporter, phosphonate, periplasmic substrate-binding protein [bacterium BMS3Abin13]GBE53049.1 ABC transporter, phosphonate, periplasmic substrate-binding protein [bacterium BMS3Bbin14]